MVQMRVLGKHCHDIPTVVLPGARCKHLREEHGIRDRYYHARHFKMAAVTLGDYAKVKNSQRTS